MRTLVDLALRDEARRFALRYSCDECVHWTGATCSNGWPERVPGGAIDAGDEVTFCKEFELGNPPRTP